MDSGFLGQAYESRSKFLEGERLINLYPEITDKENKGFMACPGLGIYSEAEIIAPVRDFHRTKRGICYAVVGDKVFSIALGVRTLIGSILTSTGAVNISSNPTQVLIVDGVSGYIITIATGVMATQTDPDFPYGTTTSLFCETFTICSNPNSDIIQVSAQNDSADWDSLDFTSAESYPDNVVQLAARSREVYAFGTESVEIFQRDLSGNFAFARVGNTFINYGCMAAKSLTSAGDSLIWLAQNSDGGSVVLTLTGYQPQFISTPAVTYAIDSYTRVDDAIGFCYQEDGHTFYVLVFPSEGKCWSFDFLTKTWHERRGFFNGGYTNYRANCHVYHERKHLIGDFENGKIYQMSLNFHDYAGRPRKWNRTWQMPKAEKRMVEYSNLHLSADMGAGLDGEGNNIDPQAYLRTSQNAGNNWSTEVPRPLGKIGEYSRNAKWARVGRGRNKTFELTGSDAVKTLLVDVTIDATILDG